MRPLPFLPDFPVLRAAWLPANREHRLELWNLVPPQGGVNKLDYVELVVEDSDRFPELLIASQPWHSPGPEWVDAGQGLSKLAPVAFLGLITVRGAELDTSLTQGGDEATVRHSLVEALSQGRSPWRRAQVDVEGKRAEFYRLSWETGWLVVGFCLGITVAVVGRRFDVRDLRLVRLPRHELEKMVAP